FAIHPDYRAEIQRLAEQYQFFHWHLAFPDVFRVAATGEQPSSSAGWLGGFDTVLGNPPWEHTELAEKEWFALRNPEIANARTGARRKKMIEELAIKDPPIYSAFMDAKRQPVGFSHFARNSGRYPLCGTGRINTYALFAELNRSMMSPMGRAGFIVQSDIATSDTYKGFFSDVMERNQLVSFYDFVNTEKLFPNVHRTHP